MELIPTPKSSREGASWAYQLVAGDITIDRLSSKDIMSLKESQNYDTELLPEIFTFREILWQPNVYPEAKLCIPQLNILKVFCEEYTSKQQSNKKVLHRLYFELLSGLASYCEDAIQKINSNNIASILGQLRKKAFPIVTFFMFHPMNRMDYQKDALNRLNYSVKIMLTQYHNKYYDLQAPYWNITLNEPAPMIKTSKIPTSIDNKNIDQATESKEMN